MKQSLRQSWKNLMIKVLLFTIVTFSTYLSANNDVIIGVGLSNCSEITNESCLTSAQQQALTMLSGQIFVNVETKSSVFKKKKNNAIESVFETSTRTYSSLPVYGARQECETLETKDSIKCIASLDKLKSTKLYMQSAEKLAAEIDKTYLFLAQQKFSDSYTVMSKLISKLSRLKQYEAIINSFNPHDNYKVRVLLDKTTLDLLLTEMVKNPIDVVTFIERVKAILPAASLLIKPVVSIDQSIPSFAIEIYKKLKHSITNTVADERNAKYILSGSIGYEGDKIVVLYHLIDVSTSEAEASVIGYFNNNISNMNLKSEAFQQSLFTNYQVQSGDLFVDIKTNKGKRGLLFSESEAVSLQVMLSQPGCFYISGFTKNKFQELGYLLQLHDKPRNGEGFFLKCVTTVEINQWLTIGDFIVEPPFGVESIQISAGSKLTKADLPNSYYDDLTGYQTIAKNRNVALAKTRGLKRVINNQPTTSIVHSVLQFRTVEK